MTNSTILEDLWTVIGDRATHPSADSYVSGLLTHHKGIDKTLEKVGEESVEFILAMKNAEHQRKVSEAADLFFHILVALRAGDVELREVLNELASRRR